MQLVHFFSAAVGDGRIYSQNISYIHFVVLICPKCDCLIRLRACPVPMPAVVVWKCLYAWVFEELTVDDLSSFCKPVIYVLRFGTFDLRSKAVGALCIAALTNRRTKVVKLQVGAHKSTLCKNPRAALHFRTEPINGLAAHAHSYLPAPRWLCGKRLK